MSSFAGLRRLELSFDATGSLADVVASSEEHLAEAARDSSDLYLFAPGWHSTKSSARALADRLFGILEEQLGGRSARASAVLLDWPFFLFPEDDPAGSHGAASGGSQLASALGLAFANRQFELDEIAELLDRQPSQLSELRRFHALVNALATSPSQALEDSGPAAAFSLDTVSLFAQAANMSKSLPPALPSSDWAHMLWRGAREVLRNIAYYELSNRAGVVGRQGLGPLLSRLGQTGRVRVHLFGHSFGARLVSYALAGMTATTGQLAPSPVRSLYLIQGAFSHFAFADERPLDHIRYGALAGYAARVRGPVISTHSGGDRLLGWWYPAAAMLKHEDSNSLSELAYRWGAMGHDGLQGSLPVDGRLGPVGTDYGFAPGMQYRLDATDVIATNQSALCGAHSDIARPEVVWPLTAASSPPPPGERAGQSATAERAAG